MNEARENLSDYQVIAVGFSLAPDWLSPAPSVSLHTFHSFIFIFLNIYKILLWPADSKW